MNKKDELLEWCRQKQVPFSSVEVNNFGSRNYYLRARRTIQDLAVDLSCSIRRIPDTEVCLRGLVKEGNARLAWYEWSNGNE